MEKIDFQYGMKFAIENGFFNLRPSLAAEKQGLRLKFSTENEMFNPRMPISSKNGSFLLVGNVFFFEAFEPECVLSISGSSGWGPSFGLLHSGVAPTNQTKERSVHELFTGAFQNKSSM